MLLPDDFSGTPPHSTGHMLRSAMKRNEAKTVLNKSNLQDAAQTWQNRWRRQSECMEVGSPKSCIILAIAIWISFFSMMFHTCVYIYIIIYIYTHTYIYMYTYIFIKRLRATAGQGPMLR